MEKRYWLHSTEKHEEPDIFKKFEIICSLYLDAYKLSELGTEVYSTDEMTGVQALERKYQDKSVCPGRSALYVFEYVRQGTLSLIASLRIADGTTHAPYINKTRNEQDFCHAVRQLVEQSPDKTYIIICDGLNTHKSESLVRLTAETMPSPR